MGRYADYPLYARPTMLRQILRFIREAGQPLSRARLRDERGAQALRLLDGGRLPPPATLGRSHAQLESVDMSVYVGLTSGRAPGAMRLVLANVAVRRKFRYEYWDRVKPLLRELCRRAPVHELLCECDQNRELKKYLKRTGWTPDPSSVGLSGQIAFYWRPGLLASPADATFSAQARHPSDGTAVGVVNGAPGGVIDESASTGSPAASPASILG